jgi:hypothetical protein
VNNFKGNDFPVKGSGWYNRVKFEFCKWYFHTPSHTIGESLETFKISVGLNKTPTRGIITLLRPKCKNEISDHQPEHLGSGRVYS